jgi:predicted DNA-binding protein (UPF0251 family)/DNA-directed RNA polymerase subunit RPC12/RpoP
MEGFKPFGIPRNDLEPVILLFEEYESIRLTDYEGLNHEQASGQMNVSRATFTRIYEQARRNIAKAFIEGKVIFIEGGDYHTDDFWFKCNSCMKLIMSASSVQSCNYCGSKNVRLLNKKETTNPVSMGAGGNCICVYCNTSIPHIAGEPCKERNCPNCGKKMMREGSYHHQLYLQKKGEQNHESSNSINRE